jgi:hypothetical protein
MLLADRDFFPWLVLSMATNPPVEHEIQLPG